MEDMPTDYDAIVVGTGLVESIYAAAAARVGKTVLHIDRNTHYSGEWAVLGLSGLLEWAAQHADGGETPTPTPTPTPAGHPQPGSRPLRRRQLVHGVVQHWYIEEGAPAHEEPPLCGRAGGTAVGTSAPELETNTESAGQSPTYAGNCPEAAPCDTTSAATQRGEESEQTAESAVPPSESSVPPSESAVPPSKSPVSPSKSAVLSSESPVSPSESDVPPSESSAPPSESHVPPSDSTAPAEAAVPPPDSSAPSTDSGSEPAVPAPGGSPPVATERAREESADWTVSRMKKLTRRFNIDLAPKVLYSRGALVELLISSNIARYAEFRSVGQLLTPLQGQLQPVPSSRADVFTTRHVSVVEKRLLMKLLSFCLEFEKHPDEYKGYEQKPFSEFLRSRRLTDNLTHHVTHAIAMVTPQTPTLEALRSTQKFLRSLGRYGNTPFLWPMYGSGELPQCFCRMCAVFGGVYYLSRGVEALTLDEAGRLTGVVSDGQRLTCRHLLLEEAYREDTEEDGAGGGVSRAVLITDRPLYGPAGDQVLLIRLPAEGGHPGPVTVLQAGPAASAAPAGLFVIHLTCAARRSAEEDLSPAVARLQELAAAGDGDGGPAAPLRLLAALYFSHRTGGRGGGGGGALPDSVAVCSGPDADIGFDAAVQEARGLFTAHFPGEEFLPRAPDPEEIIFFDEPADSVVTGGVQPSEAGVTGQDGQTEDTAAGDSAPCQAAAEGTETAAAGDSAPCQAAAEGTETAAAGDSAPCQAAAEGTETAAAGHSAPCQAAAEGTETAAAETTPAGAGEPVKAESGAGPNTYATSCPHGHPEEC